jgi:hypothetical protein
MRYQSADQVQQVKFAEFRGFSGSDLFGMQ